MTDRAVREEPLPGPLPQYRIPGWQERFGVAAGITGRDPHDPLDLGLASARPAGALFQAWDRFRATHPAFEAVVVARQVHGCRVAWHGPGQGWQILDGMDGHATATPGLLLTVTVADCIPVYLVDPANRAVALLHAGWRGVAAGVLGHAVKLLEANGSAAHNIVMHCGVGICGGCYEVGSEVTQACGGLPAGGGRGLDLRAVLIRQAQELGVEETSTSLFCSSHDCDRFFSHRASAGADGRMVAYLGRLP